MFHIYWLLIWVGTLALVPHNPHTHILVSSMYGTLSTPLAPNLSPLHQPVARLQCPTQSKCWNVTPVSMFIRPTKLWPLKCPTKLCLLKSLPKFSLLQCPPDMNVAIIPNSVMTVAGAPQFWLSQCPHLGMLMLNQKRKTKLWVINLSRNYFVLLFYRCRFHYTLKDIAVPLLSPATRATIIELHWIYKITSPTRFSFSGIFILVPLTIFSFLYFIAQPALLRKMLLMVLTVLAIDRRRIDHQFYNAAELTTWHGGGQTIVYHIPLLFWPRAPRLLHRYWRLYRCHYQFGWYTACCNT